MRRLTQEEVESAEEQISAMLYLNWVESVEYFEWQEEVKNFLDIPESEEVLFPNDKGDELAV